MRRVKTRGPTRTSAWAGKGDSSAAILLFVIAYAIPAAKRTPRGVVAKRTIKRAASTSPKSDWTHGLHAASSHTRHGEAADRTHIHARALVRTWPRCTLPLHSNAQVYSLTRTCEQASHAMLTGVARTALWSMAWHRPRVGYNVERGWTTRLYGQVRTTRSQMGRARAAGQLLIRRMDIDASCTIRPSRAIRSTQEQ